MLPGPLPDIMESLRLHQPPDNREFMITITPAYLESRIVAALPGASVRATDLTGGGDHYRVTVVAEQFAGQTPVNRHRMIYAIFKDVLGGALHALSLETVTPDESKKSVDNSPGSRLGSLPRL